MFAQTHHTLTGIITNDRDEPIEGAVVSIETLKKQTLTDANGFFSFSQLPSGEYVVVIFQYGYHSQRFKVRLQEKPQVELRLKMQELQGTMSEVIVSEAQNSASDFQLRKLNAIEGFGIYEAKKTEVILVKDLTANLSTNNARQVFSRMAGVNVWESDCAGLQLGVGARGLSPNRTANFNTRQNGYDISADAIGYPESYYTPPMEALERIEIVRGAASLQYGTQFGGMLNFVMKDGPKDKKIEVNARQTIGSYRFLNSFNSIGGTVNKWRYYAFYQRKQGDCWRCNSEFENNMFYFSNTFSFSENFSLKLEHTAMNYLAR
ncbi:MAG: carboxypeptidase-like regulatory domain-containing protein, partial [Flammeovirgaceae bacterium]|nr:carboxypeptidase-like regulatory domain-containing protein [Flammeovirgaceae bacterium]MDW8288686.1 carboxypeptidase-like regulatory domain-containing protein [Flammeovirgaceae bacterium]